MNLKVKLAILLCVYLAGYGTALKMQPPAPPATVAAAKSEEAKAVKKVKKTFNPNGTLASEETTDIEDHILKSSLSASAPQKPADNLLFDLGTDLKASVMFNPLPHVWAGYAKSLRNGEDVYKLGYSTRIF